MRRWEKATIITVIALMVLAVTAILYAQIVTVYETGVSIAEDVCEFSGGVKRVRVGRTRYGSDPYEVSYECREGGGGSVTFECNGCVEV